MSHLFRRTVLAAATLTTICAFSSVSAANREVTIVNKTRVAMIEFYASSVGTNDWEEDILGQDILNPGESVDIDMDDGSGACRFDFKGVFKDGESVVQSNVNVCDVGEFSFTQ